MAEPRGGGRNASAPGTSGADTLCQPLARLRAGAGMPPFHTYFAGLPASPPYSCRHKKAMPEAGPAQAYRLFGDYRLLDDYFVGAAAYRHHVDTGGQGHFVAVSADEG